MLWQQQQKERKCWTQETSQVMEFLSFFLSFFLLDDAIAEMDR